MALLTKPRKSAADQAAIDPSSFPEVAAARDQLTALEERHDALRRRLDEESFKIANSPAGNAFRQNAVDDAARQVLAGKPFAETVSHAAERAKAERELVVLARAVELGRELLLGAQTRAGVAIRERLLPEHRKLAGKIKTAIVQLRAAVLAERSFIEDVRRSTGFGPPMMDVSFAGAGHQDDPAAILDLWLAQVGDYAALD